jgi:hypothetical protein
MIQSKAQPLIAYPQAIHACNSVLKLHKTKQVPLKSPTEFCYVGTNVLFTTVEYKSCTFHLFSDVKCVESNAVVDVAFLDARTGINMFWHLLIICKLSGSACKLSGSACECLQLACTNMQIISFYFVLRTVQRILEDIYFIMLPIYTVAAAVE